MSGNIIRFTSYLIETQKTQNPQEKHHMWCDIKIKGSYRKGTLHFLYIYISDLFFLKNNKLRQWKTLLIYGSIYICN